MTSDSGNDDPRPPDHWSECDFVQAIFTFSSDKPSSLSFQEGDIIRVISRLSSGWWDGRTADGRGWFPSNYVRPIYPEGEEPPTPNNASYKISEAEHLKNGFRITSQHSRNSSIATDDSNKSTEIQIGIERPPEEGLRGKDGVPYKTAAYWIPQATSEGRLFYFNTETGESNWGLPFQKFSESRPSSSLLSMSMDITTDMKPPTEPLDPSPQRDVVATLPNDSQPSIKQPQEQAASSLPKENRLVQTPKSFASSRAADSSKKTVPKNESLRLGRSSLNPAAIEEEASIRGSPLKENRPPSANRFDSDPIVSPTSVIKPTLVMDVWPTMTPSRPLEIVEELVKLCDQVQQEITETSYGSPAPYGEVSVTTEAVCEHVLKSLARTQELVEKLLIGSGLSQAALWPSKSSVELGQTTNGDISSTTSPLNSAAQELCFDIMVARARVLIASNDLQPYALVEDPLWRLKRLGSVLPNLCESCRKLAQYLKPRSSSQDYILARSEPGFLKMQQYDLESPRVGLNLIAPARSEVAMTGSNLVEAMQAVQRECESQIRVFSKTLEKNISKIRAGIDLHTVKESENRPGHSAEYELWKELNNEAETSTSTPSPFSWIVNSTASTIRIASKAIVLEHEPRPGRAPHSQTFDDFVSSRQALVQSIGALFLRTQEATKLRKGADEFLDLRKPKLYLLNEVRKAVTEVKRAMSRLAMTTEFLAQELDRPGGIDEPLVGPRMQASFDSGKRSDVLSDASSGINSLAIETSSSRYRGAIKIRQTLSGEITSPLLPTERERSEQHVAETESKRTSKDVKSLKSVNRPWFLEHELEGDISYDLAGNIKGGTLAALVERLTRHDALDSFFNNAFLLTYSSFTTPYILICLLINRFEIQAPEGLEESDLTLWKEKKQLPIRLRVFNFMKSWLDTISLDAFEDDKSCAEFIEKARVFAHETMSKHIKGASTITRLIEQLDRSLNGDHLITEDSSHTDGTSVTESANNSPALTPTQSKFRKSVANTPVNSPQPILPKNPKRFKLLEIDPTELARQLTIIESTMYNQIKPSECLNKAWSKQNAHHKAEHVKAMILNSNQITGWVAESVLEPNEVRKRANTYKHFILIAEKCRELNNFSTLTAIISGLNSAPVHRLRRTKEMVSNRMNVTLSNLNQVMSSTKNFSQYRELLHILQPPAVPFLGVYLTDLTFIEDGNPDMIKKSRNLINFSKRLKTAEAVREIQEYQKIPYNLVPVPEIQSFIRESLAGARDISTLYELSLAVEPREREDEKIARLLSESGFL